MQRRGLGTPLKEGEGKGGGGRASKWVSGDAQNDKVTAGCAASSAACTHTAWQDSATVRHDREAQRECIREAVCTK